MIIIIPDFLHGSARKRKRMTMRMKRMIRRVRCLYSHLNLKKNLMNS